MEIIIASCPTTRLEKENERTRALLCFPAVLKKIFCSCHGIRAGTVSVLSEYCLRHGLAERNAQCLTCSLLWALAHVVVPAMLVVWWQSEPGKTTANLEPKYSPWDLLCPLFQVYPGWCTPCTWENNQRSGSKISKPFPISVCPALNSMAGVQILLMLLSA